LGARIRELMDAGRKAEKSSGERETLGGSLHIFERNFSHDRAGQSRGDPQKLQVDLNVAVEENLNAPP
jgi:hypothetical protein